MLKGSIKKLACTVYSADASQEEGRAKGVYWPTKFSELEKIVAEAVSSSQKIVARGAGTGLVGSCVPKDAWVIDLSSFRKIYQVDEREKTVWVEAGVVIEQLNNELKKYGLFFPVQPGSFWAATIGGVVATNAMGLKAFKYGRAEKNILDLEIIDGTAKRRRGEHLIKDIIGKEGLTGIVLKAKLKLAKLPQKSSSSLKKFENILQLLQAVKNFKKNSHIANTEFLDDKSSEIIGLEKFPHLLIEYENEEGKFKGKKHFEFWQKRATLYPRLAKTGHYLIEDPQIPEDNLVVFLEWLAKNNIPSFGHLGVNIIHPCFKKEQENLISAMYSEVQKLGGKITGEHGIGLKKKQYLSAEQKEKIAKLKKEYDPYNIFNPGKLCWINV